MTGDKDGPPLHTGINLADSGAGYHCAIGILAALYERNITGKGQRVEVAMQDVMINFSRSAWGRQLMTGKETPRVGNEMPMAPTAPCNVYPCKPGGSNDYVFIYTSRHPNSDQWERLLKAIGRADLFADPRFATPESRYENREEIDKIIANWTKDKTKHEAMEILGKAGVPAGAVLSTLDITKDSYLKKRGTIVTIHHPERGKITIPGNSIKLSNSKVTIEPAPLLGEHTKEILSEYCDLTDGEFEKLKEKEVI